jgi:pyruvate dehydrogenase E1 component
MPKGIEDDVLRGLYQVGTRGCKEADIRVRLIGSGTILNEVIAAADSLLNDFNIASDIFSATSFTELEREARAIERTNRLSPSKTPKISHVQACLPGHLPIIAATDYVRALPQLIAPYLEGRLVALGTDGFGRSDKRAVLRKFFEVDSKSIVIAAIEALARAEMIEYSELTAALEQYEIDGDTPAPWTI